MYWGIMKGKSKTEKNIPVIREPGAGGEEIITYEPPTDGVEEYTQG